MTAPLLELRKVDKSFGSTSALRDVSLAVPGGRVHAVVGENGAGKSTLLKILSGIHQPDAGAIVVEGEPTRISGPAHAQELGIQVVHQELALLPELTVAENIVVGGAPTRHGLLDRGAMKRAAEQSLELLGARLDVSRRVDGLRTAEQQFVEVARGLLRSSRALILDEPTAALSPAEASRLLEVLRRLARDDGLAVVFVSHRLAEVFEVADDISVLRDGRLIQTTPAVETDVERTVRLMVGRELAQLFPDHGEGADTGDSVVLEARGLIAPPALKSADLQVREGEIVGLYGLEGGGQDELLACLAGGARPTAGTVRVRGHPVALGSPRSAMEHGIGYVPPDRKQEGLLLEASTIRNISLAVLRRRFGGTFVVSQRREATAAKDSASKATVRGDLTGPARRLSGGNQQKVLLARLLRAGTKVFLLNQPTRGVDVGAKTEIYGVIRSACDDGSCAVVVSPEIPELVGLCDRVVVLRQGAVAGEIRARDADEEIILQMAVQA